MATAVQSGWDGTIDVVFEGNIAVVTLNCGENRINSIFIEKYHKVLDAIERNQNVEAVITTSTGKFFCNGLDLDWLQKSDDRCTTKFDKIELPSILMRLLTFPLPTIAAINGHAFAGGFLLAICHDYRLMRTGRGWMSMNEVYLKILFEPKNLISILRTRLLGGQIYHETIVMGKVYTAQDAQTARIVDGTCEEKDLMKNAFKMANNVLARGAYDRQSLGNMKMQMFQHLIDMQVTLKAEYERGLLSKL